MNADPVVTVRRPDIREIIFDLIDLERAHQEVKHAGRTCSSPDVDPHFKNTILAEEFGEVGRALLDGKRDDLKAELVQVAAVAVAWLEHLTMEDL